MRQIVTIAFFTLLVTTTNLFGQNTFNQDFGSSFNQVKTDLQTLEFISLETEADKIIARTDRVVYTYHFIDGQLAKIVFLKKYTSRKEAETTLENFETFYSRVHAHALYREKNRKRQDAAFVKDQVMYEVSQFNVSGKNTILRKVSTHLRLYPGNPRQETASQNVEFASLNQMF